LKKTTEALEPKVRGSERQMQGLSLELPTGYYLERDPDVLTLRRSDGSVVGAFSAHGVAPEAVRRTVEETVDPAPGDREGAAQYCEGPELRVRFFGRFEVLLDGEPLPLGRNGKALCILKYLLASGGRPVSQDRLMGWLWPESSPKKARWSLNSAVHSLRKLLSARPSPTAPPMDHLLVLEEGHYRLDVGVSTDVEEFEGRYGRGRRLEAQGRGAEAAAEYEQAVALYRGEYLLEDLYEDWTMVERERLSNAHVDMLGRLAAHYAGVGREQEAVGACYGILEKDRCHEESYRLLMRCYARLGLRGRALRQYRLCERTLEQEYGVEPSPETQMLYAGLLGDESI
jgi:DNA-binding SARP family transcriptional activator